ncbi:MAG: MFS transporter [Nitrospirota bacterium]|mgnify:CR=1 FL=1
MEIRSFFSSQAFSALKHRNFRLFWTGQLISFTGTWVQYVAQGWLVLKLTDSPFYLGLVGAAGSLPVLLFTLIGGVIADRVQKRIIIILTQIFSMILSFLLAVLTSMDEVMVWHILLLATLFGIVNAFDIPARQSFQIEMVGREDLLNAIALNSAAFNAARIIGPAVAGLLIGYLGLEICFYINAFSFIPVIVGLFKMTFSGDRKDISTGGFKEKILEGLRFMRDEPKVFTLILLVAIISLLGIPFLTLMPVFARDILKVGPTGLGLLMSSAGAGAFIGAIFLAFRIDIKKKGFLVASSGILFSLTLIIFSLSRTLWLSMFVLFIGGWGMISLMATANSLLQLSVPDDLRGRVMSAFALVFLGFTPIGNLIIGWMAEGLGTPLAVTIGGILCLITIILLYWRRPEMLRL